MEGRLFINKSITIHKVICNLNIPVFPRIIASSHILVLDSTPRGGVFYPALLLHHHGKNEEGRKRRRVRVTRDALRIVDTN